MVQVTTVHDTELNQKIFRVRGDEGYARETKISIVDRGEDYYTYHAYDYNMQVTATLQRGVGASHIAVIDNGITVDVIEWASTDTTKTITIQGLTYDVTHNISVKFLGNTQCLKSTSNTLTVTKQNSTQHTTQLTLDDGVSVVDTGDGGTITFKLKDGNEYLEDKTVKIYVDGIYEASATTNSSGQGSYNLGTNGLDHGLRKITLRYDGGTNDAETILYQASVKEFDYSVGINITVENYPSVFVNGSAYGQNQITATVSDYFGEPLNNITVTLSGSGSYTGTSDSNGKVTITPSSISNHTSYYLSSGTSQSMSYTFKSATVTDISITANQTMVTPNSSIQLTVQLTGTNIQKDIPVRVNTAEWRYTDDSGKFYIGYTGSGYGDREISVLCGGVTDSITIEDLLFYYGSAIPNYAPMTAFSQSVTQQTNGLKLNVPNGSGTLIIGLGDADNNIGDWELTYDVVYHDYNWDGADSNGHRGTTVAFGSWNSQGYTYPTNYSNANFIGMDRGNGSKFRIRKESGAITLYRKYPNESEQQIHDIPPNDYYNNPTTDNPLIIANRYYVKNIQLIINNVKLKKLRNSQ